MAETRGTIALPEEETGPLGRLGRRVALALGLILFVALVAFVGRDGYEDADGDPITVLDAFYYATVSITTTGYGDITPVTEAARLATVLLVTPARVLFLILLVGTTLEVLAAGSRAAVRRHRWRQSLRDHTIVCGYGTKGRSAISTLVGRDVDRERIVVIDPRPDAVDEANRDGLAAILGDAARTSVLEQAGASRAQAIVVAADRDDTSVLITLTARELNPDATIVAAVREDENRHLLHQSGADSVITSSGAAGRLLGFATGTPQVVEVLEDLLAVGRGLDLVEQPVGPDQAGPTERLAAGGPIIGVIREGRLLRFDHPEAAEVRAGDRVVQLCSNGAGDAPEITTTGSSDARRPRRRP